MDYNVRVPLDGPPDRLDPNIPLHQSPTPEDQDRNHDKKVKHQRPAEDDGVIFPRIFDVDVDFGNSNGPRKNPEDV